MGDVRANKSKCRSGRHDWTAANIVVKNGVNNCKPCLLEKQRASTRKRRELARTLGEAQLIEQASLHVSYWPRIEKQAGCWIWHGCKDGAGYGYMSIMSRPVSAHRIAYRLEYGAIPEKHEVCHRCDTPLCVNPEHLFVATHEENMRDMRGKGRWPGFPNHFDQNGKRKS